MVRGSAMSRVFVVMAATSCVFACTDATPVGSLECLGDDIRCGFAPAQSDLTNPTKSLPGDMVSPAGSPIVMPAWSRPVFEDVVLPPQSSTNMMADARGELWSVRMQDQRVHLVHHDREGAVVDDHLIEAPERARDKRLSATVS